MDLLRQLGNLCLQAVPTIIIAFLFYLFVRWSFFKPLDKVLAERKARIEGARADAATAQSSAEQELETYNEALKRARAEIYAQQEAERQKALDERAKLLKAMRTRSAETVERAKRRIAGELDAARVHIDRETPALAEDIARNIVERPGSGLRGMA